MVTKYQYMKKNNLAILFIFGFVMNGYAQSGLTALSTDNFLAFSGNKDKWQVAKSVEIVPNNDKVKIAKFENETKGTGILVGEIGASLSTTLPLNDVFISFQFMLAPNTKADLMLPNGLVVNLQDSWTKTIANSGTCGYVAGNAPLQNVCKAPGLWQTVSLSINPTALEFLRLNGILLQENIVLNSKASSDFGIEVKTGTLAIRNVKYQTYAPITTKPLTLRQLKYSLYKGYTEKPEDIKVANLIKNESTTILTQEWGYELRDFALVYEGQMDVAQTNSYQFDLLFMSAAQLEIDGQIVIKSQFNNFIQEVRSATVSLSAGQHPFKLTYNRISWRKAALGLMVAPAGSRAYALHEFSSLPEADPMPLVAVTANSQPEMIRSFVQMPNEKTKRTHTVSIGTPYGVHYTYDLERGALLQQWRGQFADVTEMWYERGEPQLLKPLGAVIQYDGKPSFATLPNEKAAWPDSITNDLIYRGLQTESNIPTFKFTYKGSQSPIKDYLLPTPTGLERTIVGPENGIIFVRVAVAKEITQTEGGMYNVEGSMFIKTDTRAILRTNTTGDKELLLPVVGSTPVKYAMIW